jgi:hypothetical protein
MRDIEMMRAPSGDHPEAIGIVPEPARTGTNAILGMHPLLGMVDLRRGPEPHVIVWVGRDRLLRIVRLGRFNRQTDLAPNSRDGKRSVAIAAEPMAIRQKSRREFSWERGAREGMGQEC